MRKEGHDHVVNGTTHICGGFGYKIPKERQKSVAQALAAKEVSQHGIAQTVAEIAKKGGWTSKKKERLPKMPPEQRHSTWPAQQDAMQDRERPE